MGTAEKGPAETKDTRERRFFQQEKEESADFGNAEWDHHGHVSPLCRLNALRLTEGFHGFFSGVCSVAGSRR